MGECRTERSVGLQREMHGLIQRCHLELTVGYGTPAPTARQGDRAGDTGHPTPVCGGNGNWRRWSPTPAAAVRIDAPRPSRSDVWLW
jgi:hypothetical protein